MGTKNALLDMLDWVMASDRRAELFRSYVVSAILDDSCPDDEFVMFIHNCIRGEEGEASMFGAIVGYDIDTIIDRVRSEIELEEKAYTIEIHLNNLRHKDWWTWGNIPLYHTFSTLNTVLFFLRDHKLVRPQDEEFLIKRDECVVNGRLACTSWYTVTKGKEQMTEYTSL